METSILLAKIFGLLYLVVGIGMLIDSKYYKKMMDDVLGSAAVMFFGGAAALAVGLVMVTYHNVWTGWPIIITIIGWIALIKGVLLLLLPSSMMKLSRSLLKSSSMLAVWGVVALVLGLILGYLGFVA